MTSDWRVKADKRIELAHTLWSAGQLIPGEGIEDGVRRILQVLDDFKRTCEEVEE